MVDPDKLQAATQGAVDRVQGALSGVGGDPAAMSSDQRKAEIGRLVLRRVTDGQLSQQDRDRLNQLVPPSTISVRKRRNSGSIRPNSRRRKLHGETEETARRAADTAASSASIAAFSIFAIMLLGAHRRSARRASRHPRSPELPERA